ncbi:DUF7000 family protein [Neptunitalea lumnitzerae]|uniref:DUF7000 domain-containing protein n=1 Tax=Neptunitalea lumnitzerae TaxID=2965509 RepID=A0ABQ5MLN3_9FLAO|nr:hypothetical protein [Neptunitalea sp. Y10]GLB50316.1 hypothetical protein Y10_26840 [Neptunitalea sp. Y10]
MKNLNQYVAVYKEQLQKGDILIAYNELVKFVMNLRTDCINQFTDVYSFTGILHGYLDYTYFYFSNDFLKSKKLKLGIVLNHVEMRFEVWLLGNTKKVHQHYLNVLKDSQLNSTYLQLHPYAIVVIGIDNHPDFDNLPILSEKLQAQIKLQSETIIAAVKAVS